MIDLYTWATPNGRKVSILLEELGADYSVHPVDIGQGAQKTPDFLQISPNGKIPAIVDRDTGMHLMESGAILLYLAEKHGRFLPADTKARFGVIEWVMWQMGGLGPIAGQAHHYMHFNPGVDPYAEARLAKEVARLYAVLEARLAGRSHVCDEYSIADMAIWPWVSRHEWHGADLRAYPNLRSWYKRIAARAAVQRGYHVPDTGAAIPPG